MKKAIVLLAPVVLMALAAAYQLKGNVHLLVGESHGDAVDLRNRWAETHYYLRGVNPYDVCFHNAPSLRDMADRLGTREVPVDPHLGMTDGSQPPWGYGTGLLLTWPDWPEVRYYFAAVNFGNLAARCFEPRPGYRIAAHHN